MAVTHWRGQPGSPPLVQEARHLSSPSLMSLTWKFPEELLVLSPGNTSSAIRNATATGQIHYGGDGEQKVGKLCYQKAPPTLGRWGFPRPLKPLGQFFRRGFLLK